MHAPRPGCFNLNRDLGPVALNQITYAPIGPVALNSNCMALNQITYVPIGPVGGSLKFKLHGRKMYITKAR